MGPKARVPALVLRPADSAPRPVSPSPPTPPNAKEPTDGLTFEKFQQTLKKNRDALMQRHGCKRVKFSVYVKEGRASLKATPVRE